MFVNDTILYDSFNVRSTTKWNRSLNTHTHTHTHTEVKLNSIIATIIAARNHRHLDKNICLVYNYLSFKYIYLKESASRVEN